MSSPQSACFFYLRRKIRRNRHGFEWVDVSTARVTLRHQTESSAYGSSDDAKELPQTLAEVPLTKAPEEHVPMDANMLDR